MNTFSRTVYPVDAAFTHPMPIAHYSIQGAFIKWQSTKHWRICNVNVQKFSKISSWRFFYPLTLCRDILTGSTFVNSTFYCVDDLHNWCFDNLRFERSTTYSYQCWIKHSCAFLIGSEAASRWLGFMYCGTELNAIFELSQTVIRT